MFDKILYLRIEYEFKFFKLLRFWISQECRVGTGTLRHAVQSQERDCFKVWIGVQRTSVRGYTCVIEQSTESVA